MILAITAYFPIPGHPRPAAEYEALAAKLFKIKIPLIRLDGKLESCWLYHHLLQLWQRGPVSHSIADNPRKNTPAYHIVQAQKFELIALAPEIAAAYGAPAPRVIVWIDLGIFHLPGVTSRLIEDFMARAASEQAIAIPGCWEKGSYQYDDRTPCWRFCGGLMVVPRKHAAALAAAMQTECKRWLELTGNLSFEVNTLARVEERYPELPIWWYKADHDASMFTNYQGGENADGRQTGALRRLA